jgi:hypothetical protein
MPKSDPAANMDAAEARTRLTRAWLVSLGLVATACVWLAFTTSPPDGENQVRQFFGLWRTRNFAVALALVWLAFSIPVWLASRRARVRWLVAHGALVIGWFALEGLGLAGFVHYPKLLKLAAPTEAGARPQQHLDVSGVAHEALA